MRRADRALTQQEARDILQSAEFGVLSITSLNANPYGVPLNYCTIGDSIYFHSALEGRKVEMLSANEKVSFCVVGKTEVLPEKFGMKYESVIVSGKAHKVDGKEKQQALEGLLKKYSSPFYSQGLEYIEKSINRLIVFKITIESITAKAKR